MFFESKLLEILIKSLMFFEGKRWLYVLSIWGWNHFSYRYKSRPLVLLVARRGDPEEVEKYTQMGLLDIPGPGTLWKPMKCRSNPASLWQVHAGFRRINSIYSIFHCFHSDLHATCQTAKGSEMHLMDDHFWHVKHCPRWSGYGCNVLTAAG